MADTKEIIRVLGFIQEYFDNHADEQESKARKELFRDWSEITLDAIALLKAQEPRVMTLEEVKMLDCDYYYLESMRSPGKEMQDIIGAYCIVCVTWPSITWARQTMGDSGYGKTWRCWNKKPTNDQRKNTPWIEGD